jgi:uncharacterized membrane-anchored protein
MTAVFAGAALMAGCALDANRRAEGPAEIALAPYTRLKVAPELIFVPPADAVQLMQHLGERPGAEVLGVVLTRERTPRMLILFATSRDARGVPAIELVGWDEASLAEQPGR